MDQDMSGQGDLLQPSVAPARVTTDKVREMMRKRYPAPEWAFLEEVAPRTGGGSGYTDAVAVNLFRSRGHAIHGFEIKVSRGDWLKELRTPNKAEEVAGYCDYWWLVAAKGIVYPGELPTTWGLIEATPATLKTSVAATKRKATPVSREFFASLVRRAHSSVEASIGSRIRAQTAAAEQDLAERIEVRVKQRTRELANLEARVAKFEKETGLSFDDYTGPPIAMIKLAQKLEALGGYGRGQMLGRLATLASDMERTVKVMRDVVASEDPQEGGADG